MVLCETVRCLDLTLFGSTVLISENAKNVNHSPSLEELSQSMETSVNCIPKQKYAVTGVTGAGQLQQVLPEHRRASNLIFRELKPSWKVC